MSVRAMTTTTTPRASPTRASSSLARGGASTPTPTPTRVRLAPRSPRAIAFRRRRSLATTTRAAASEEDDIEAIEARLKRNKGKNKKGGDSGYFDSYPEAKTNYPKGEWEVDPGAWDARGFGDKAWSAWSGEPGVLWWMNKGSFGGAGILAFCWVLFRLVGPALGLYQLN
jgi:hypothetical protein